MKNKVLSPLKAIRKFSVEDCMNEQPNEVKLFPSDLLKAIKKSGVIPLRKLKSMIWQDEIHDSFILTKKAEIFLYNDETIAVYLFKNKRGILKKLRILSDIQIWHEIDCDDSYI